ncbi:MAG: DUF2490 domain-containing protein [Cyclobacteriaceae bacterium]|jgi:hypothetical protein|nr:DUF2490 domain-containing protein [Cytophagales bacterium]MCZ8326777.1 DUF2490 domain-containing protein [Cyclobacteriaceae bacterium]
MKKLILALLLLTSFESYTQNRETVYQLHSWWMYFGNHRITNTWSVHTEYQFRRADFAASWQQSLTRIGIDYRIHDNIILTAGYGFIRTFPYGEQPIAETFDEHRIWQTLTLIQPGKFVNIQHRYRLEQRWLERFSTEENNGYLYLNRIRYRLLLNKPISIGQKPTKWFVTVSNEVFIGFGKNVAKNIVDQNRLAVTLGYTYKTHGNIQLGYMNQTVIKRDGVKQEQNSTITLALTYNIDFRK